MLQSTSSPVNSRPLLHFVGESRGAYDATPKGTAGFAVTPKGVLKCDTSGLGLRRGDLIAVYSVLAGYANAERECWPSIATICAESEYSKPHVIRLLNALEELGLIARERRFVDGMKAATLYRLLADDQMSLTFTTMSTGETQDVNGRDLGGKPQRHKQEPVEQESVELNTPSKSPAKPKKSAPNYTPEFEAFWRDYPKDHGVKSLAFKEWAQLSPEDRTAAHAALDAWKRSRKWQGGFIRECQRWLDYREWEQIPDPAISRNGSMPPEIAALPWNHARRLKWEFEHPQ